MITRLFSMTKMSVIVVHVIKLEWIKIVVTVVGTTIWLCIIGTENITSFCKDNIVPRIIHVGTFPNTRYKYLVG